MLTFLSEHMVVMTLALLALVIFLVIIFLLRVAIKHGKPGANVASSAAAPRKPITVTTPNKINVTRGINGRWIRSDDNTEVTDPREIKGLNQLAINQRVMQQKAQGA